jgi:hypothetical protein
MIVRPDPPRRSADDGRVKIQPVVVVDPLVWLLMVAWKPIAVLLLLACVGLFVFVLVAREVVREEDRRAAATATVYALTGTPMPAPRTQP